MTDYWVSNERKFCDFCKCWITDNKASISFHESGKRHKAAVAQRITDITRTSVQAEKEKAKMDQDIRKMNEAALRAYSQDISARGDMTARSINEITNYRIQETSKPSFVSTSSNNCRSTDSDKPLKRGQIDPLRLPGNSDDEDESKRPLVRKTAPTTELDRSSLWIEAKTDDNNTYYWNVKTNESVWEAPKEGFMPLKEYNEINEIALAQQSIKLEKEVKSFRNNADEEVARYNREKFKNIRKESKKVTIQKEKTRQKFLTQDDANSPGIGEWQPVIHIPVKKIDWELPEVKKKFSLVKEVKKLAAKHPEVDVIKEKTFTSSLIQDTTIPTSFKKRKIQRGNARQPLIEED